MKNDIKKQILLKLSQIQDPDLKKNIVELNFVKDLTFNNGSVEITLELTSPACPVKEDFKNQAKKLVSEIKDVTNVTVHFSSLNSKNLLSRENQKNSGLKSVKNIIAVSSCKGGVGKSTISSIIASELASRDLKVGLLDVDIFGPSLPTLFDLKNTPHLIMKNNQIIPLVSPQFTNLKLMSFGFLMGNAPSIMRGPMVTNYISQVLHQVKWEELDYLIIDLPPGTGDVQLTLTQSISLDGAIIVTTKQSLSIVDVSRGILMFEKLGVPLLGIVDNLAYFLCNNCNKKHFIYDNHSLSLSKQFGLKVLQEFPLMSPAPYFKDYEAIKQPLFSELVDNFIRELGKKNINMNENLPSFNYNQEKITVKWPNGNEKEILNFHLRLNCPCATCKNEYTHERQINENDIAKNVAPKEIMPIGNYALMIDWNDGHNSGIYSYELLKTL